MLANLYVREDRAVLTLLEDQGAGIPWWWESRYGFDSGTATNDQELVLVFYQFYETLLWRKGEKPDPEKISVDNLLRIVTNSLAEA